MRVPVSSSHKAVEGDFDKIVKVLRKKLNVVAKALLMMTLTQFKACESSGNFFPTFGQILAFNPLYIYVS